MRAKVKQFLDSLVPADTIDEAFVCGPLTMIDEVEVALIAAGCPAAACARGAVRHSVRRPAQVDR